MLGAMPNPRRTDLVHDLVLPTLLFAALGGMTWAVRGCSGFGAWKGCLFAGVTWGAAWWFLARRAKDASARRYTSAWIILAFTIGIGFAGNRGWMQWPSFFLGHLQTNTAKGEWVPIPRGYGFLWLFLAGVPWAGLGACLLAWCGLCTRPLRTHQWLLRLTFGLGAASLAVLWFNQAPSLFLPLYDSLQARYADLPANPNLRRLINDNRAAIMHLGAYLGFLAYEIVRRDWKNVTLIGSVGLLNGIGWALCQNWTWAAAVWPQGQFNYWRCWESSGGISIGIAYGIAFFLVNRPGPQASGGPPGTDCPNLERFAAAAGVIIGLCFSLKNGLKGWANIYLGQEAYWDRILWHIAWPLMLIGLAIVGLHIRRHPRPAGFKGELFPHDYRLLWLVLVTQNVIAQLVTGPLSNWTEAAFSIYYLLLFLISTVIVHHVRCVSELPRQ